MTWKTETWTARPRAVYSLDFRLRAKDTKDMENLRFGGGVGDGRNGWEWTILVLG